MIAIKARKYGDNGQVKLSLRIKNGKYDNNTSLNMSVDEASWKIVESNLKTAIDAYKRGLTILISDTMTSKLWNLVREFMAMDKSGSLRYDSKFIAENVRKILYHDEIQEAEAVRVEATVSAKPKFIEFIEAYIKECESGERLKQKSTRKITAGTIKNYKGFLSQMKEYQSNRKCVIDWDDLDLDFYRDYKQYFIEKQYSPNTIARHIKTMKTMLYAAKDLHLTTRDDFTSKQWSADREDVDNIYIPEQRLKEMFDFDMSDYYEMKKRAERFAKNKEEKDRLIHALKRDVYRKKLSEARDIFLMGCFTGQRVSDYKRICDDMIETIQGDREFLHLVQQKTEKDVYIPYNEMMGEILKQYGGKLPDVYDQHLNERIKVVGLLLGWTEPAELTERRGVMEYKSDKRFCDALATHTARRTFATNAYKNGVSLSAIMSVTGHASEDMLRKYLKLGTKEKALLAAAEFDKVKSAL